MRRTLSLAVCLPCLLSACASNVPVSIRQDLAENPSLEAVQKDPDRFRGKSVRWGGALISVTNRANGADLEVLAKPLQEGGRPEGTDNALGRFRARVERFLDPEIYQTGREVTLFGTITGSVTDKIGERNYLYPLVAPIELHIWEKRSDNQPGGWPVRFGIGFGFGL